MLRLSAGPFGAHAKMSMMRRVLRPLLIVITLALWVVAGPAVKVTVIERLA